MDWKACIDTPQKVHSDKTALKPDQSGCTDSSVKIRNQQTCLELNQNHPERDRRCLELSAILSTASTGFTNSSNRNENSDSRYNPCDICVKQFHNVHDLLMHKRRHTGERPYPCTQCSKRFYDAHNLKQHLVRHTDERPYTCSYCSKRFPHESYLKRHMTIHTDVRHLTTACRFCDKRVHSADVCRKHVRLFHRGEKRYCNNNLQI